MTESQHPVNGESTPPHESATRMLLETSVKHALNTGDGEALLEAVENITVPSEILIAANVRLLLRDMWVDAKANVAGVPPEEGVDDTIETNAAKVISTLDAKLEALKDASTEHPQVDRLAQELRMLDPSKRIDFIESIAAMAPDELATADDLLPWAEKWRNSFVEVLWQIVQEIRAQEATAEQSQAYFTEHISSVMNMVDRLIYGSLHPAEG